MILTGYYQFVFALLHKVLGETGFNIETPHPICKSFWQIVPPGEYSPKKARPIVLKYKEVVEKELEQILSRHSVAYWLHAYRRLFPGPAGIDKRPHTIALVRGTFEAAIQKYGKMELCRGVGFSNEVDEKSILDGMLMAPEFKPMRENLKKHPQLVLTKFGCEQLRELYDLEKLAYEVWRCAAALRILGKGAPLIVPSGPVYFHKSSEPIESPVYFSDNRSDELDQLVSIYDKRLGGFSASATGTIFEEKEDASNILLPVYNVESLPLTDEFIPNFFWVPFNLKRYFKVHEPFGDAFENKYGLPLAWIGAVIDALRARAFQGWQNTGYLRGFHYWQHAYEGPYLLNDIINEIREFLPSAVRHMEFGIDADDIDISGVINFLGLNEKKRKIIDPLLIGPHSIFLPLNNKSFFIDYAWIERILYNLFFGVNPVNQNFKGEILEKIVHRNSSALPTGPCCSLDGTRRQIDAAFEIEDVLIIVECKAVGKSFGFERGDFEAVAYRNRIIETALQAIDEKGRWLAANHVGKNYNIQKFKKILPIVVTPFIEYIPSLNLHYWLSEDLPRVMSPRELQKALEKGIFKEIAMRSPNSIFVDATMTRFP